jgi:nucleoside-diphosphate-sugar epimerase
VTIVLTGATRFIGSRVRRLLAGHGHTVAATARGVGHADEPGVAWVTCDVTDPAFVDALPGTADAVVHLAQADGSPPGDPVLSAVNVESTRVLLDYARRAGARRFVLASSGSVYGGSPSPLREDQPRRPRDAYARSKSEAESLLEHAPAGLEVCVLRLFAPYGPGQKGRLIADLVARVSSGRPVTLRGEGHPKLNPIFVDDVAEIVVHALESPVPPILNVAGDEVLSIRDMAETIGRVVGTSPCFEDASGDPPPDLVADTTLLRRTFELGELIPFERGIAATVGFRSGRRR